jgi:hypothetical protein
VKIVICICYTAAAEMEVHLQGTVPAKENPQKVTQGKRGQEWLSLDHAKPKEYSVRNYPNPFNPTVVINVHLLQTESVKLKIFDAMGRVAVLLKHRMLPVLIHQAELDRGNNLSSGIYLYKLQAGSFVQVKRMLLAK